jgi:hypothetical protein
MGREVLKEDAEGAINELRMRLGHDLMSHVKTIGSVATRGHSSHDIDLLVDLRRTFAWAFQVPPLLYQGNRLRRR